MPMNFFKKFFELQVLMLQHNAGLTASHPYATFPINWPFDISGISFWTENDLKMQVYAIGNLAGWWICVLGLSVFIGIIGADQLARRRGVEPIEDRELLSPSPSRKDRGADCMTLSSLLQTSESGSTTTPASS